MTKPTYVLAGAGLASVRAIEQLRRAGFDGHLVLVGDEPTLPYERPALSKEFLRGERTEGDLLLEPASFFKTHDVTLELGVALTGLDLTTRRLELAGGRRLAFDRLLLATGAEPRPLDVRGAMREGVHLLRSLADAQRLRGSLEAAAEVVVVGAGLLGLELAATAVELGKRVTVVERADAPLRRVLGPLLGAAVTRLHRARDVQLLAPVNVVSIAGAERVSGVELSDGRTLPADVVLVALGARPRTRWLEGSGVALDDGVLVDPMGRTNVPGVFAAGDVARWRDPAGGDGVRTENFGNAHEAGQRVGRNLAGASEAALPVPSGSATFFGERLQFAGDLHGAGRRVSQETANGFISLLFRDDRLVGAATLGRPREFAVARRFVATGRSVEPSGLTEVERTFFTTLEMPR